MQSALAEISVIKLDVSNFHALGITGGKSEYSRGYSMDKFAIVDYVIRVLSTRSCLYYKGTVQNHQAWANFRVRQKSSERGA